MSKRSAIPSVWLCWFTCLGSLAAYCWATGDQVTSVVIGLVGAAGLAGYSLGAAVVAGFLLTVAASALLFPARLADAFDPFVSRFSGTSGVLNHILATCFGCALLGLVAMLLIEIVWNRLLERRGKLKKLNKTIGLSVGALQGAVLSLILLGGMIVAEPYARLSFVDDVQTPQDFMRNSTADCVIRISRSAQDSTLGPWLLELNPFERLPPLRQLHRRQPDQYAAY